MTIHEIPDERADGLCRVYLIEDDATLLVELSETLSEAGLQVLPFATAEAFLEAGVQDDAPAVIVSDMVLPGVSGIGLYETIRAAGIQTPMVYISGYSEPNQIIEGMKLGAVDFLWKPFNSEALLEAVRKSLALDAARCRLVNEVDDVGRRWFTLTEREQEVGRLMLIGYGNKDVAEALNIQPDTVNKHRMKVFNKMGVSGRAALMALLKDFEPARHH